MKVKCNHSLFCKENFQTEEEEQQTENIPLIVSYQSNYEQGKCFEKNLKTKLSQ